MIRIFQMCAAVNPDIVTDPAVFVHDGVAYITTMTDSYGWQTMRISMGNLFEGLIVIIPIK
jgi:hypothetical protein